MLTKVEGDQKGILIIFFPEPSSIATARKWLNYYADLSWGFTLNCVHLACEKVSPLGTIRTWLRNRLWEHLENFIYLSQTPWSLNTPKFWWSHWRCQSKVQNPQETIINLAFPVHMEMLIPLIEEKHRKALTMKNRNPRWIIWVGFSWVSLNLLPEKVQHRFLP